jgi:hypothetical protein
MLNGCSGGLEPALVVASGSGPNCHAYWPLVSALSARGAEAANLWLVDALRADPNCFDASRILRTPVRGITSTSRHILSACSGSTPS